MKARELRNSSIVDYMSIMKTLEIHPENTPPKDDLGWSCGHELHGRLLQMLAILNVENQGAVWFIDHDDVEDAITRTKDELKHKEPEDEQQQESPKKKFEGISICILKLLMGHVHYELHGSFSFLPLHLNKLTIVTCSFLHLEDKVKVWAAGIDKPRLYFYWFRA